jgi:hypothetical protein
MMKTYPSIAARVPESADVYSGPDQLSTAVKGPYLTEPLV